jgi:hypothetical protein
MTPTVIIAFAINKSDFTSKKMAIFTKEKPKNVDVAPLDKITKELKKMLFDSDRDSV